MTGLTADKYRLTPPAWVRALADERLRKIVFTALLARSLAEWAEDGTPRQRRFLTDGDAIIERIRMGRVSAQEVRRRAHVALRKYVAADR